MTHLLQTDKFIGIRKYSKLFFNVGVHSKVKQVPDCFITQLVTGKTMQYPCYYSKNGKAIREKSPYLGKHICKSERVRFIT